MKEKPYCICCGEKGKVAVERVSDFFCRSGREYNYLKCPRCKLFWVSPQPSFGDLIKMYESFYDVTLTTPIFSESENKLKKIIRQAVLSFYRGYPAGLGLKVIGLFAGMIPFVFNRSLYGLGNTFPYYCPNGKLLEVGCGRGWYLKIMKDWGWKTLGFEFNPESAEKGRKLYNVEIINEFDLGNIPDESFDVITMIHVFEHLYDPEKVAKECLRILKPRGVLLLAMPNADSLTTKFFGVHYRALAPPWHLHVFSPISAKILLDKVGFETKVLTRAKNAGYVFNDTIRVMKGNFSLENPSRFSYWFQILESTLNFFARNLGEELEVIARKN